MENNLDNLDNLGGESNAQQFNAEGGSIANAGKEAAQSRRTRIIIGWVLTIAVSLLLFATASAKFTGAAEPEFVKYRLEGYLIGIGILEVICTILFIIPMTSRIGVVLLSSYFGGAIVAHLTSNTIFILPLFVLFIIWTTAFVKDPDFFGKFLK
ncbi:MAG: hypothetical protein EAZ55_13735 [Cytophagales bacterium]|nr:MAG: hypothetical protein EAZ55_13735 [Cytophagales bacterium]